MSSSLRRELRRYWWIAAAAPLALAGACGVGVAVFTAVADRVLELDPFGEDPESFQ